MAILPAVSSSAMHGAVVPIGYQLLSNSTTRQISFSNIPQGYQDLKIVWYGRSITGSSSDTMNFDFLDSSTLYSETRLGGTGSSTYSDRATARSNLDIGTCPGASATSGIFANAELDILNYANTSTYKTILIRCANDQNGSGYAQLNVGLWSNTNAITSLRLYPATNNFTSGSSVTLYGIRTVGQ
jgi:hypothetical protein